MIELGELEKHHEEFAKREVRIVTASVDGLPDTQEVQKEFPHLTILSDEGHSLVQALNATHPGAGPKGADIAAPTTLLVHRHGRIVWTFRPVRVMERLSVEELTKVIEQHLR